MDQVVLRWIPPLNLNPLHRIEGTNQIHLLPDARVARESQASLPGVKSSSEDNARANSDRSCAT